MGDIALRGNKLTRGPHGHGPKPFLNKPGQAQGTHGGKAKGGRAGLKDGGKPWGTGPKPGTIEFFQSTTQTPKRKGKVLGGPAARTIKKKLTPGVFKKDSYKRPWEKPPQLKKSQKERREELRKRARKSGGHSKIIFADEWKHIDPGLQKGLFKKEGGRIGYADGNKVQPASHKSELTKWFQEKHGGTQKAKPHSTRKGRIAAGKRALRRGMQAWDREQKERRPGPQAPTRTLDRSPKSRQGINVKDGGRIGFRDGKKVKAANKNQLVAESAREKHKEYMQHKAELKAKLQSKQKPPQLNDKN